MLLKALGRKGNQSFLAVCIPLTGKGINFFYFQKSEVTFCLRKL